MLLKEAAEERAMRFHFFLITLLVLLVGSDGAHAEGYDCSKFQSTSDNASAYLVRLEQDQLACDESINLEWYFKMNRKLDEELELMECDWDSALSFFRIESVFDFICLDPETLNSLYELRKGEQVLILSATKVAQLLRYKMLRKDVRVHGKN